MAVDQHDVVVLLVKHVPIAPFDVLVFYSYLLIKENLLDDYEPLAQMCIHFVMYSKSKEKKRIL